MKNILGIDFHFTNSRFSYSNFKSWSTHVLINCCPCLCIKDPSGRRSRKKSIHLFGYCVIQSENFESLFCYQKSKNSKLEASIGIRWKIYLKCVLEWSLNFDRVVRFKDSKLFHVEFPVNLLRRNFHQKSNQTFFASKPDTSPNACSTLCWMKMNTAACCSNMFRNLFSSKEMLKRFSTHKRLSSNQTWLDIEKDFVSSKT